METAPEFVPRLPDDFPTASSRLPPWSLNPLRVLGLLIDYLPFGCVIVPRWGCELFGGEKKRCPGRCSTAPSAELAVLIRVAASGWIRRGSGACGANVGEQR